MKGETSMSKLQKLSRLESLRKKSLVVMGIFIAACIIGCIALDRFANISTSYDGILPQIYALAFALFAAVVALIAGITAIVLTSQISALRKMKD